MATHSNILDWRVPMDRGAWGHKELDMSESTAEQDLRLFSVQRLLKGILNLQMIVLWCSLPPADIRCILSCGRFIQSVSEISPLSSGSHKGWIRQITLHHFSVINMGR